MRVSLIRPRTGNTPDPPLGLMLLSACAKQSGHAIQILDPNPDDETYLDAIRRFEPDAVGFSILTTQVSRTRSIMNAVRTAYPDIPMIAGGIHPTSLPEWTLNSLGFDYVVRGEGEHTFPELLNAMETGMDPSSVPGVVTINHGEIRYGPPRPLIGDLDSLPLPDRETVNFHRYLRPPGNIRGRYLRRATSIITSRGCPFGCIFCSSHTLFGRQVRRRSVSHVMEEIHLLQDRYGVDGIWFLDDTLLEDPDWLRELCAAMKETGLPWGCQAHVRRADETLFKMMRDAGCLQLEFGVESGSPRILRRLRKGSSPDDVRRAFAICRRVGLRALANFMIGIPDETEADAEMSFQLAREIRPDHVVVTFTTPLPGSTLFTESLDKGWLDGIPDFSRDWIIRQTETPAVALSMDRETMMRIRKKFDNEFFWTNIKGYFRYPQFLLDVMLHILRHPGRYARGFSRAIRTGRLLHVVETVWEEYNRV